MSSFGDRKISFPATNSTTKVATKKHSETFVYKGFQFLT